MTVFDPLFNGGKGLRFLILLIVGLVAYANGLNGPMMIDDHWWFHPDTVHLRSNPGETDYFRPLSDAYVILWHRLFAGQEFWLHLVNLITWCAAALTIQELILGVFNDRRLAWLTSLFYLIHPVNGIAVEYITASAFSLEVIFIALGILASLKGKAVWAVIHFAAGVLSHETAVLMPFYLTAVLIWERRVAWPEALRQVWLVWLSLVVYVGFRLVNAGFHQFILSESSALSGNISGFISAQVQLISWYLSKLFDPTGVVIIWTVEPGTPFSWPAVAVLGMVSLLVFYLWTRWPHNAAVRLGLIWLFIGFLPLAVISKIKLEYGLMIEPHWFVFSSVGFFLIFASLVIEAFRFKPFRSLIVGGLVLIVMTWVVKGWQLNHLWADEVRYCEYWLKHSPSLSSTALHLARIYEMRGQPQEARGNYLSASLNPKHTQEALTRLGFMHFKREEFAQAQRAFERARALQPELWDNYNHLGLVALQTGDLPSAESYFQESIRLDPCANEARENLKRLLKQQDRSADAMMLPPCEKH